MCFFTSFYLPCWSAQWPVRCSGQYQWQTHFYPQSWCQSLPNKKKGTFTTNKNPTTTLKPISIQWAVPGTWWRTEGVRCMAAGLGGAAPPAGPHWTAHPPGSRGLSWRHRFTHKTARSERHTDRELAAHRRISALHWLTVSQWNNTVRLAKREMSWP